MDTTRRPTSLLRAIAGFGFLGARAAIALCAAVWIAGAGCKPGSSGGTGTDGGRIVVFAGAASQPATQEIAARFEKETGIRVDCTFGGSGAVLNQIRIEHFGDVYLPGSNDYMDIAEKESLVDPATRRVICYLVPVICVPPGNPKGIQTPGDLGAEGMKVTIGDPASVCLGSIAKSALEKAGVYEQVKPNIVTYAADCQQVVNLIRLQEVDAAIGYDVFERQSPDQLESVALPGADEVNIPAAVVSFSERKEQAMRFVEFISGPIGKGIFAKHGYTVRD